MKRSLFLIVSAVALLALSSCKKETETFQTDPVSDYAPYTVGKYITYHLDSTVYVNFGSAASVVSYEVMYEVSAETTDNLNRPAFRITRYIRKTSANEWTPDNTFLAINTGNSLEFVENNLRYLKLKEPIKDGYSWKGNSYIDTYSFNSDVKYLDDWDYMYDSVNTTLNLGTIQLDNTLKVEQRDEVINNPDDLSGYSEINYSSENYAKGIGLVYRRFLHQEYQPPTPGVQGNYLGYGVTLTMIDHN